MKVYNGELSEEYKEHIAVADNRLAGRGEELHCHTLYCAWRGYNKDRIHVVFEKESRSFCPVCGGNRTSAEKIQGSDKLPENGGGE